MSMLITDEMVQLVNKIILETEGNFTSSIKKALEALFEHISEKENKGADNCPEKPDSSKLWAPLLGEWNAAPVIYKIWYTERGRPGILTRYVISSEEITKIVTMWRDFPVELLAVTRVTGFIPGEGLDSK